MPLISDDQVVERVEEINSSLNSWTSHEKICFRLAQIASEEFRDVIFEHFKTCAEPYYFAMQNAGMAWDAVRDGLLVHCGKRSEIGEIVPVSLFFSRQALEQGKRKLLGT